MAERTVEGVVPRTRRFLQKPWRQKFGSAYARWRQIFPRVPVPIRVPSVGWFLARGDFLGSGLVYGGFEAAEQAFVKRYLRAGMTVLDIGANQGLYTLLAAKCVGTSGRVVAFEPSPRERRALAWNLRLNGCRNVTVESVALGNERVETEKQLYVVDEGDTGCNSLKPPAQTGSTSLVTVRVGSLDECLKKLGIATVDFIKLDVEGAELSVLQGAESLWQREPRPVVLAEVQDLRTEPWGYRAKEIIRFLQERQYKWFHISEEGRTTPLDVSAESYDGNFVAYPDELEQSASVVAQHEAGARG